MAKHSRDTRRRPAALMALTILVVVVVLVVRPGASSAQPADHGPPSAPRFTLDELIQRTLRGPRARMAHHETRTAEGRVTEARGAAYPKLTATPFVAPSPDIDCVDASCTRTTPEDASLRMDGLFAGARISAVQPLYGFGKLSAITHAARAAARATAHLEDATAGDLAVEAARAYYGLKLARELVWMLEDGLAEIASAQERIEEMLAEGTGEATVQDRLRIETLRAEIEARLSEARQAATVALAGVRALTGAPDADVDEAALAPVDQELATVEAYRDRAAARRPELEAARAGAEAAQAKARFEVAQYWPVLVLVGELNVARAQGVDDPPSAFAQDPFNTTRGALALAMRWQLDPMSQRGRVAQARAQADRARALAELAERGAAFEATQAHAEATEARARLVAAEAGQKSARGWVASVLQATAVGTAETKDLADAFIAYFTLRARHATSVYEWNLATVRLRRAAGEFAANPHVPGS